MEREFKWVGGGSNALRAFLAPYCKNEEEIFIDAVYYDTPDCYLTDIQGGLRLRAENQNSICCLKLTEFAEGGLSARREYECAAASIEAGIHGLYQTGAPAQVLDILRAKGVAPTCKVRFTRQKLFLQCGGFSGEFVFDKGRFNRETDFEEMELEFAGGDSAAFLAFGRSLRTQFALVPQPLSKLAQAILSRDH